MNEQLIFTALIELLDFAARSNARRAQDVERYIALREQVRKELVQIANAASNTTPNPIDERSADAGGDESDVSGMSSGGS